METSILKSTKKILGVGETDTTFDLDIITFINGAFSTLEQLGIGPAEGFQIIDDTTEWQEYLLDIRQLNTVKVYVFLVVGYKFDPPTTSYLVTAKQEQITELESRMSYRREDTEWRDPNPPLEVLGE